MNIVFEISPAVNDSISTDSKFETEKKELCV